MGKEIFHLQRVQQIWQRVGQQYPHPFTILPQDITQPLEMNFCLLRKKNIAHFSRVTHLDLSVLNLSKLPKSLSNFVGIETLDLSHNKLTRLPNWLKDLKKLRMLKISGNPFPEKDRMRIVEKLALLMKQNLLTVVTSDASLNIQLGMVSDHIQALFAIWGRVEVQLFKKPLKLTTPIEIEETLINLPPSLCDQVTELSVRNANLNDFPNIFTRLRKLKTLDLSGNRFTNLPEAILSFKKLSFLNLKKNPIPPATQRLITKKIEALPNFKAVDQASNCVIM
jgi:Leucine-rich repeat (LRR) protein